MVFLFKGIAPPSQFPATVASGAPPRPNHAFFQDGVDVRFEPLGGAGGGGGLSPQRAHNVFLKKKFSLHTKCPQREYVLCMHIASPTYLPYVPLVNHMLYSALHLRYAWRGVPQLPKRGGLLVSTVLPEATQNTRSIQHWMAVKCPESFATYLKGLYKYHFNIGGHTMWLVIHK